MSNWSNSYLVAGVHLEIISLVGDASRYLPIQMRDFASSEHPDLTVELHYDELAQADPLKRYFPSKYILTDRSGDFVFEGTNGKKRILGNINNKRDKGEMGLPQLDSPWRIAEEMKVVGEALEAFVRACMQCYLLKVGGTLIHAAGLAFQGGGYAFSGHTRAGKTTLTRGVPSSAIMGDDLVAIRNEGGQPLLFGTPWPGREGGCVAYGGLPLRAIFDLQPELPEGYGRMGAAEAVAQLMVNAPRLGFSSEENELLANFSSAASAVPIYKLSLKLGDDITSWLKKFKAEEEKDHRQGAGG